MDGRATIAVFMQRKLADTNLNDRQQHFRWDHVAASNTSAGATWSVFKSINIGHTKTLPLPK